MQTINPTHAPMRKILDWPESRAGHIEAAPGFDGVPADTVHLSGCRAPGLNLIPNLGHLKAAASDKTEKCAVAEAFQETFHTDLYQSRKCGENIRRLLERVSNSEDFKDAKVLGIKNEGVSYFGMVRATHVRSSNNQGQPRTTDMNWYHHVVLEKDGKIYDFDFGVEPQAPTVEEYFQTMFFDDTKVKAQEKKNGYSIQVIEAQEYLHQKSDSSEKLRLGDYLARHGLDAQDLRLTA